MQLPIETNWQDLRDLCESVAPVMKVEIIETPDGRSRGAGIVRFSTFLDADRVVRQLNGFAYGGRLLDVHLDRFTS